MMGDDLKNPPDGGKVRHPWEAVGMSRATWYRRGRPDWVHPLAKQSARARSARWSLRAQQRLEFVERYGIPEIHDLWIPGIRLGTLERVAKLLHDEQHDFVLALVAAVRCEPKVKPHKAQFHVDQPILAPCCEIDTARLRAIAGAIVAKIEGEAWSEGQAGMAHD